ncbi:hypothetical protein YC2023_116267 [Brassica napus]
MILSLCCLGSWPAILTLLERRGRLPQHTFLDFTTANLLAAIVIAFTLGEVGKSTFQMPDFTTQLLQDNWPSVLLAVVGGVLLSVGNLATQYALAFVGLPVTEVITASITVVIDFGLYSLRHVTMEGGANRATVRSWVRVTPSAPINYMGESVKTHIRNGPAYDDNEIVSSLMFSPPAFPLFLLRFPATLRQQLQVSVRLSLDDETVMESLEHAMKRDAPLVANILEALLTVILLILLIQELGLGVSSCIESYLEEAGVSPEDVNYIYAHATSTLAGDLAEINALKKVFKALQGSKSMPLRSIEITQVQRLQMKVHKYLHEQFEVLNSPA